jgi:hypothetical protein
MVIRFSLAILFAVIVAASRPVATGGDHDILAVGVRWEETVRTPKVETVDGRTVETFTERVVPRLSIVAPTEEALEAHRRILATSARQALVQGSTVFAAHPADAPAGGPRIRELVYYGVRSRPARSPVAFGETSAEVPEAFRAAHEAALSIAALPSTVTGAGARLLLASPDDLAYRDALEALVQVKADAASAAALDTALSSGPRGASTGRRVISIRVLNRLGGDRAYPEAFRRLRGDDDPLVREAVSR